MKLKYILPVIGVAIVWAVSYLILYPEENWTLIPSAFTASVIFFFFVGFTVICWMEDK